MIRYDFNLYIYGPDRTYLGFVDGYSLEYFTWADRRHALGDFQAKTPQNQYLLNLLQVGNWVRMPYSNSLMRIDEQINQTFMEQGATIEIRGKSIDSLLYDRAVPFRWNEVITSDTWPWGYPQIAQVLALNSIVNNADDTGHVNDGHAKNNLILAVGVPQPEYGTYVNLPTSQIAYLGELDFEGGSSLGETINNLLSETNFHARIVHDPVSDTPIQGLNLKLHIQYILPSTGRYRIGYEEGTLKSYRYLENNINAYETIMICNDRHYYYFANPKYTKQTLYNTQNRVYALRTSVETTDEDYKSKLRLVAQKTFRDWKTELYIDGEIDYDLLIGDDPISSLKLGQCVEIIDTWGSPATIRVVEEIIYTYDEDGITIKPTLTTVKEDRGNYPLID